MPWVATSATTWGWEQLSSFSSGGGDAVGFALRVDDQYPLRALNTNSVYLLE